MGDPRPIDEMARQQARLREDVRVAHEYGARHPEAFVEVRYGNADTVSVVVLFAGDEVAAHRAALEALVPHPDALDVRSTPWPVSHLEAVRTHVQEVARSRPGAVYGWGIGRGRVNVHLRADQEPLAAELLVLHGPVLDITLGVLRFPDRQLADDLFGPRSGDATIPPLLPSGIEVVLEEDVRIKSGLDVKSSLLFTNRESELVGVRTNGLLTARVVDPADGETVGVFPGAQPMPLVVFRIAPGESSSIPVLIGSACPAPALGYATPPGRWAIEFGVALGERGAFRSPRLPITIVG